MAIVNLDSYRRFKYRILAPYLVEQRVGPSKAKAKKMLADDSAHGKPLSKKQKKFFKAVSHGFKPTGKGM